MQLKSAMDRKAVGFPKPEFCLSNNLISLDSIPDITYPLNSIIIYFIPKCLNRMHVADSGGGGRDLSSYFQKNG